MRIIEPGNIKELPYTRTKCAKCGCVFEYQEDDLMLVGFRGHKMAKKVYSGHCPQEGCYKLFDVEVENLK